MSPWRCTSNSFSTLATSKASSAAAILSPWLEVEVEVIDPPLKTLLQLPLNSCFDDVLLLMWSIKNIHKTWITGNYFCGHCKGQLSKTLFFRHKRMFYDWKARKWSDVKVISEDIAAEPSLSLTVMRKMMQLAWQVKIMDHESTAISCMNDFVCVSQLLWLLLIYHSYDYYLIIIS